MQLEQKDKERNLVVEVSAFFIAMGIVISILVRYFSDTRGINVLLTGFFLWGIIYFLFLYKHFWIFPEPNYAVVLQNHLQISTGKAGNAEQVDGAERHVDDLEVPAGQRGCTSRIIAKLPWESVVMVPIHMVSKVDLGSTMLVQDKNGVRFNIVWQAPLTPIPGKYLPRYFLVDDESAKKYFDGAFQSFIETEFKQMDGKEVMADMQAFKDKFKNRFGGPNTISDDERRQGRFTGSPQINSVVMDNPGQKADQAKRLAEQTVGAIEAFTNKGVKPDMALAAALLLEGYEVDVQTLSIPGLDNMQGNFAVGEILGERSGRKGRKPRKTT